MLNFFRNLFKKKQVIDANMELDVYKCFVTPEGKFVAETTNNILLIDGVYEVNKRMKSHYKLPIDATVLDLTISNVKQKY